MIRHQNTSLGFKRMGIVLCLLTALTMVSFAQPTFTLNYAHLTSLSIGDIDFKTFGSNNWFFTLSITNPAPSPQLRIHGDIGINLADGSINSLKAATLVTKPFPVNGSRTISNLDIGSVSDIKTETFQYDGDVKTKLQNQALGTGKLPAGTYTFDLWLSDSAGTEDSPHQQFVLNLENISRLDLTSPQDNENLGNMFPFFQWIYDGQDVELSVYEKRPTDQSKEDALSGTPMLRISTGTPGFPSGSKSLQYPASAVRSLEVGKTYVWQVKGATVGTGGVGTPINSEIWQFKVIDPTNSTSLYSSNADTTDGIVNRILNLLPGMTQELIDQLLAGNYTMSGVFLVDGVPTSAADVAAILRMLAANPDRVIEITLVQ